MTDERISQVWNKVMNEAEILQIPQAEYDAKVAEYTEYYTSQAEAQGISLNEYASTVMGMTVKEYQDWLETTINDTIKEAGVYRFALRMYPNNPALPHRQDFAYVRWF